METGKGRGGDRIWRQEDCLTREEALQHWTSAGAWFSREEGRKGQISAGHFADFAVLDRDYFNCDAEEIPDITSDLTIVGGRCTHAKNEFSDFGPEDLPPLPDWSPVNTVGAPGRLLGQDPRIE
ncbi:MAG: amidohydrolase family protein [Pseudomonadota bacterium]